MRYLTVIYYDSFARFFAAIEDAVLNVDEDSKFLHLALFPSGWLLMKQLRRRTVLLPWAVHKTQPSKVAVSEEELDSIVRYHSAIAGIGTDHAMPHAAGLRTRAQRYVDTMAQIVDHFDPDVVLFSGDTRVACESLAYYLNASGSRAARYFFEQGPNGTTIFDSAGVNANASFREELGKLTGQGFSPSGRVRRQKARRNPLYRGSDYAMIHALRVARRLPPEWDTAALKKLDKRRYEQVLQRVGTLSIDAEEVLVALQVPDDANNIHHNPLGFSDADVVRLALDATEGLGLHVRVREHPLYRRRYSREMYSLLETSGRALLSSRSLDEDLESARRVVTVNSTTGVDAYLRGRSVVVLGNAYYDHLPGILVASDVESLRAALTNTSSVGITGLQGRYIPAQIMAEFSDKYLIEGHYQDKEQVAPGRIAVKLIHELPHDHST